MTLTPTLSTASWSVGRFLNSAALDKLATLSSAVAVSVLSTVRVEKRGCAAIFDIIGSRK